MCTLLVAVDLWEGHPLVVAANRDERLDRPSGPPRAGHAGPRKTFSPVDLEAGGTWWGVNDSGLLAAITNRFVPGPHPGGIDSERRSRGLLVDDALSHTSAEGAVEFIANQPGDRHNPFHLVIADAKDAWLVWSDGRELTRRRLERGWHVLTERSLGAAPSGREDALADLRDTITRSPTPPLDLLESELKRHADFGFDSTCVHVEANNYGTRSSLVLRYDGERPTLMRYANGPPCQTDFVDLSLEMTQSLRLGDQSVAK